MTDDSPPATTVLSVSKPGDLDCRAVANALWKAGIAADVSENISVREGTKEGGCRITIDGGSKRVVGAAWGALKGRFAFNCAHVNVASYYQGCINDFLRPSLCPEQQAPK